MSSIPIQDKGQLANLLASLPPEKCVAALVIRNNTTSQDEWLNPLAHALRQRGFFTLGILIDEAARNSRLDLVDALSAISTDNLKNFGRINLFILSDTDMGLAFPADSKVLGCVHAFETIHDTGFYNQMFHIGSLDGLLVPFPLTPKTKELTTRLWPGFASRERCKRKDDTFTFIPAPYPRLATLAAELEKSNVEPDSITYAPMTIGWATEQGGLRIKKYGKSIIRNLLATFPDKNIIFRPYKSDLNSELIQNLCAEFRHEPRFILDDAPGRMFSFSRSALLITDLSHIGKSFSYATLRPAIYYRPWAGRGDNIYKAHANFLTYSMRGLLKCATLCLAHNKEQKHSLLALRNEIMPPIENGIETIANIAADFCNGVKHKEWLCLKRFSPFAQKEAKDLVKELLAQSTIAGEGNVIAAAAAALLRSPESPLLLGFALHLGKISLPDTRTAYDLGPHAQKFLNLPQNNVRYADIDPDIVRLLYARALHEFAVNNDEEGKDLTEGLLRQLNDSFPQLVKQA